MSNYRTFYGSAKSMSSRQLRRWERKTARDQRLSLVECFERNPSRPKGLSGNPARRAEGHYVVASWGGEPGECGEECVCGVTYDGFDSIKEAGAFLDRHIAASRPAQPRQPLKGSFSRYVAVRHDRPVPPHVGQPAWARRFDLVERAR